MLTVETRATSLLTAQDLAPLRRMLGAHSMVIRVNLDGSMMPFEIMPELFLGRSIRQLLTGEVREQFDQACREVIESETAQIFAPDVFRDTDEVMITPVLDDSATYCQFLVVWARRIGDDAEAAHNPISLSWSDLNADDVQIRYRAVDATTVEAAPWWNEGAGIDLWANHHRLASVGLAAPAMSELVAEAIPAAAAHDAVTLRIDVPAAEMLPGLIQVVHATLRSTGIAAERVVLGIPVELAVDPDLLPVIVHLRTLGLRVDIVGLDALTAKLHLVSDTSDHRHTLPPVQTSDAGEWTADFGSAVAETAKL